MGENVLIAGGNGFIGRNIAKHLHASGYNVKGIGHGIWLEGEMRKWGFNRWVSGDININNLKKIDTPNDIIIHCAGTSSVQSSFDEPMQDFLKNVFTTMAILDYIREFNPEARLIFLSSAAVYGNHDDTPIKETNACKPISPYGIHKRVAEELCLSYMKKFGLRIAIIRLFSVYGEGQKGQLFWDACNKLNYFKEAYFFGTGNETRDWLHINDVLSLIILLANIDFSFMVINGGSGTSYTVIEALLQLRSSLGSNCHIKFNHKVKLGDPKHYLADISKTRSIGWKPMVYFKNGIIRYANWFKEQI